MSQTAHLNLAAAEKIQTIAFVNISTIHTHPLTIEVIKVSILHRYLSYLKFQETNSGMAFFYSHPFCQTKQFVLAMPCQP